ncbi:MAG: right-handed parallel beta-helix repeat-containing protein, partial [Candidatus Hodarchaeales archaeon]
TSFSFPIIEIRNSQDYFSIRNCIFLGADIGIKLISAKNADISENTFLDTGLGIEVRYSLNINIKDNLFQSEEGTGIRIEQAENITISNNKIKDADEGIIFENAKDMIIDNNSISSSNSQIGINFEEVDYSNITRNRINGFNYGIFLDACIYVNIRMNIIYENGHGIHIGGSLPYPPYSSRWNNLSLNLICENDEYTISLDNLATFNTIQKNIFSNSNQFFALDLGKNNSFTQNYWHEAIGAVIEGSSNTDLDPLLCPVHLTPPTLLQPQGNDTYSSHISVQWLAAEDIFLQELNYSIYYSSDNGSTWHFLSSDYDTLITIGGMRGYKHQWTINTSDITPGSNYLVRVIVSDPFGFSVNDTSDSPFTIELPDETPSLFSPNLVGFMLFAAGILMWAFLRIKKTGKLG